MPARAFSLIQHLPDPDEFELAHARTAAVAATARCGDELREDVPFDLVNAAELLPPDALCWRALPMPCLLASFVLATFIVTVGPYRSGHPQSLDGIGATRGPCNPSVGRKREDARVLIREGQDAQVRLPNLPNGRSPVSVLDADPTTYTPTGNLDVAPRLDEALSPGIHRIEVQDGALLLLDGKLAIGGQF